MDIRLDNLVLKMDAIKLISEIDEFKGSWKTLRTLAPERLASLRHVATIESIGSSTRIEGSHLSDREVERLLAGLSTKSFRSRDEEEVAGYAEVMDVIFNNWQDMPVTENYVKQLHQILLKHSSKDVRHRGEYKKLPNHVEAFDADGNSLGVIFHTTSPLETPLRMQELIAWLRESFQNNSVHPLITVGAFVVAFLAVHPFQDGNGRLSRALTTLYLLKAGYQYVPYSSLENVIEASKDSYYIALRRTQATLNEEQPDWDPWLNYFLRTLHQQKSRLEAKISREELLTPAMPPLSAEIIELARAHGRLSVSEVERLTSANRNTIKKHLSDLVTAGILNRYGQGRSTWYTLR